MAATYATMNDPVETVVSLLSSNWTSVQSSVGNDLKASGGTLLIDSSWDLGKTNLKNNDVIRCYEVSGGHDILGIGNGLDKHTASITIDIATQVSRSRLRNLYLGAVHIIHASHAGNLGGSAGGTALSTDYASIKLQSRTDQSDKLRRWYRYVLNCEITSYEVVN